MTLKARTCQLLENLKQRLELRKTNQPRDYWSDAMDRCVETQLANRHGY